jgi:kinesin family protein 18/19
VRWRDDETEEGTLADFEKTPKRFVEGSPEPRSWEEEQLRVPKKLSFGGPRPFAEKRTLEEKVIPVHVEPETEPEPEPEPETETETTAHADDERTTNVESSPSLEIPEATSLGARPSRFQAGFLSKGSRKSIQSDGSPVAPSLQLNLAGSSPAGSDGTPPLRSLDVSKTGNLSPPGFLSRPAALRTRRSLHTILDENAPPQRSVSTGSASVSGSGSDSEAGTIDARKLRSAMHTAMKDKVRRASLLTGTGASNARRVSSIGSLGGVPRPSMSGGLASSSNGISRHRRGSLERKKSLPMSCSPPDWKAERSFTAGQARRMNLGNNTRTETQGTSPSGDVDRNRRVTIGFGPGSGAGTVRRQESRGSMTWR